MSTMKFKSIKRLGLILSVSLVISTKLYAIEYHVSAVGKNTNLGTIASPFLPFSM